MNPSLPVSIANRARNSCSFATIRLDSVGITRDYMGRQPAVGVRNVRSALDHDDFGVFVQPAQTSRARCTSCHSANDDDLHGLATR